jgi:hypothetical protein
VPVALNGDRHVAVPGSVDTASVEAIGLEPTTPCLQSRCSTN